DAAPVPGRLHVHAHGLRFRVGMDFVRDLVPAYDGAIDGTEKVGALRMKHKRGAKIVGYALITLSALAMIVPFVAALMNSLKTYKEFTAVPPKWIPDVFQWSNYSDVLQQGNFGQFTWNSLIVSALS